MQGVGFAEDTAAALAQEILPKPWWLAAFLHNLW